MIDEVKSVTQDLEISKSGNVYTIKTVSPNQTREIQFELGKEFDAQTPTGAKPVIPFIPLILSINIILNLNFLVFEVSCSFGGQSTHTGSERGKGDDNCARV